MPDVVLERLTRLVRGETHLHELSATLKAGQLHVLVGSPRAGKTTLLRLIAGLDRPTTGEIRIGGNDVTCGGVRARNVAMVYQQFVNYPSLTVYENIASPLRVARAASIDARVRRAAERLQLSGLLGRLPSELSGGQQQRLALARALVRDADIVLLDEPLANLDYKLRDGLRREIREVFAGGSAVTVYATSDPVEALSLGGQALVLEQGRLVQAGPVRQLYERPERERTAQILSETPLNLWPVRVADREIRVGEDLRFPVPAHMRDLVPGSYRLAVRAHDVRLVRSSSSELRVPGILRTAEITGSQTLLHAMHGIEDLYAAVRGVHPLRAGAAVEFFVRPERAFAFAADGRIVATPEG